MSEQAERRRAVGTRLGCPWVVLAWTQQEEGESIGRLLEPGRLLTEPLTGEPAAPVSEFALSAWLWPRLQVKQMGSHVNTVTRAATAP